jgi:uroporphyrinogen-III synthase
LRRILLLRPEEKREELKIECAEIINFPILRLVEDDFSLNDLNFDTFIFTSKFAYISFKRRVGKSIDEILKGRRIIAIGEKTASAIDFESEIPDKQNWKGIVEMVRRGERVLIIRSRDGNRNLPLELERRGAFVKTLDIYHAERIESGFEKLCSMFASGSIDAIIFSSGLIAESFFSLFEKYCVKKDILPELMVSLGEETSNKLREFNVNFIEVKKPDISMAVREVCNYFMEKFNNM